MYFSQFSRELKPMSYSPPPNISPTSTPTPPLTGTAQPSDVAAGKTFYNTDPDTKLTGTYSPPVLTGTAQPSDVAAGDTFYNTDPESKQTGTYSPPDLTGTAQPSDVAAGKTFYNTDPDTKLTGTSESGPQTRPINIDTSESTQVTVIAIGADGHEITEIQDGVPFQLHYTYIGITDATDVQCLDLATKSINFFQIIANLLVQLPQGQQLGENSYIIVTQWADVVWTFADD
jgi:hypothetical protein